MASPIVKLNLRGINELMKSEPVQRLVDDAGQAIADRAGPGYVYTGPRPHRWVARGYVQTTDFKSMRDNARNNTLLKAL